ncbi:PepSY domain-containing protein [Lactobacillus ultunensis]|uniref:Peptidase propeptide and YPEB domain protein n=1 Tax=Lactobacillus ultunensis DSM 16047 TaxID=525365 RepID=C2EPR7_9LACO|nr:PepSY domain-containing protein [Lactobacillus ultunensis]EEJ71464.1 peptidase propeptide and YPEB domain protein [Lactobacillus ultunensis DSM 16047]QQP28271.1 PepSY domain-containing protein [Lactobacillus ultunensis]
MRKFLTVICSICVGIAIGIFATQLYASSHTPRPSNVTVRVGDFLNRTQTVSYSSDKLPPIRVNQSTAIKKFKSLYSSAVIKSITLTLDNNIYVYNIVGYDERKDCMIQVDATNNKIIGQSTQVLDYDYEKETSLNLNKTISRQEATAVALKEIPNATPISWELLDDNDLPIWKINLVKDGQKHEVKINAQNKEII